MLEAADAKVCWSSYFCKDNSEPLEDHASFVTSEVLEGSFDVDALHHCCRFNPLRRRCGEGRLRRTGNSFRSLISRIRSLGGLQAPVPRE